MERAKVLAKERSYPGSKFVPTPTGYYTMSCHCTNCDNEQSVFISEGVILSDILPSEMVPCEQCKLNFLVIERKGWQHVR